MEEKFKTSIFIAKIIGSTFYYINYIMKVKSKYLQKLQLWKKYSILSLPFVIQKHLRCKRIWTNIFLNRCMFENVCLLVALHTTNLEINSK
jgi:hypothetical protein